MPNICRSCGKIAELKTCPACSAAVCRNCLLEYGCRICKGRKIL